MAKTPVKTPAKTHGNKKSTTVTDAERLSEETFNRLFTEALSINERDALSDGSLGFMARAMVQATLPHSEVDGAVYTRSNGEFTLSITNGASRLPFGTIPRLLLAWMTTEAVRTDSPTLILGDSLSEFMQELDMVPTGGRWGSITRLRDQVERLATSSIHLYKSNDRQFQAKNFTLFDEIDLWWEPKKPDQSALWQSTLTLNKSFFDEITNAPVPVDMRALKALRQSPMALDLYVWLTYRMSYLKKPVDIPWDSLRLQLGAGYADTPSGRQGFRKRVVEALIKVMAVYPGARVQESVEGLLIRPSPTHITKRKD